MDLSLHRERRKLLETINWIAFLLHATLALSAIASGLDRGSVRVPVFWPRSEWNSTYCQASGYSQTTQVCPSARRMEYFGDVNFTLVLIASQSITCGFHFLQALQSRRTSSIYIQWSLMRGIKIWHWVEYTFTGALLAHTILYFSGMLSIQTQLMGYAAQSTLMLVGLLQDLLRHCCIEGLLGFDAVRYIIIFCFVVGFYNVSAVWSPSLYKLFIDNSEIGAPPFVKWIVLSEFILYTSFGFSQLAFYAPFLIFGPLEYRPRFFDEELVLSILSFVSKALLASAFSVCLVYRQCGD